MAFTGLEETSVLPTAEQRAICQSAYHRRGDFVLFERDEVEQSLVARFETLVNMYPQRLAVKTRDQTYTYQSLNQYANRIAQVLIAEEGEGAAPVVLVMDQSAVVIAAILGVLKAGKYYVPIDTLDPPVRISSVLEDVQARLILTDHAHFALSSEVAHARCKVLNAEMLDSNLSDENPDLSITPDHLASIFYTSGSTGRPKGVMHNHCNVLHNIMRYTNTLHICKEDRLSLVQSPNFSGTVSSLFGALLNGATICPINLREESLDGLGAWINEMDITIYHSVPTIFRSFLKGKIQFPSVRLIRLEGDRSARLDVELYQQYFSPECLLVNGLGTTETGLCRQYFVDMKSKITDHILPIGYPVMDMDILLLDEHGHPVGADQNGQIAVKSRYLCLGYWQQPELTQAAFFSDPKDNEMRIYHTGDMGRLRADGCLEYLGRKNFQLKIRGQKVEPAEVEQALLGLPFIREAAVTTHEDPHGNAYLVAYLVSDMENDPPIAQIRGLLRQHLPDALIPSRYVFLDSLPVTSTGKIDRRALPEPTDVNIAITDQPSYTPPQTATEKALASIWEDLLNIQRIGIEAPFFELGGHSLLAAQMFTRIEKQMGLRLPLSTLFQAPTLGALASLIDKDDASTTWSPLVSIQPHGSNPPFFFVHDHTGQVIGYHALAQQMGADQPFYGLQASGLDGKTAPVKHYIEMAANYIKAIKTVQPHGPYYLGGWCYGGSLAYEMAQQLQHAGEAVKLLVMVQSSPPDYPRYKPSTTGVHRLVYKIVQKLDLEWCRLKELPGKQRKAYLSGRFQRLREILSDRMKKLIGGYMTKSPSEDYHRDILQAAHNKAYVRHRFSSYAGNVLLIRVQKQPLGIIPDETLGWKDLIQGEFEIHEVPGHNPHVLEEPRVHLVAELVTEGLKRAGNDD